jgi:hypothetical protein
MMERAGAHRHEQGERRGGHDNVEDHHEDQAGDAPTEQPLGTEDVLRGSPGISGSDESFHGDKGAEGGRDDDHREGEPR